MKKISVVAALICIIFLSLSFNTIRPNEGDGDFVIMTKYGSDVLICYGNGKSDKFELKNSGKTESVIKVSNDSIISHLNNLRTQGYAIKACTSPPTQGDLIGYSIILERK